MNAILVLLVSIAVLICGYVFYGSWLAKQWGIEPDRVTPAHELEDGVDFVPAKPYVVLGHHFSSIAGAGPINGPIQAAVFGWVPVLLWVLIGGIFFGAQHDFGSLLASIRNKGATLATVVRDNIGEDAKKLFCVFAYLTLVLVVAAFASIVANTFQVMPTQTDAINIQNSQVAMISTLFIVAAVIWGFATRGRSIPTATNVAAAIVVIVAIVAVGYNLPNVLTLGHDAWMYILGVYILIASVTPVWILLQPRDYLSSYLLYGMLVLAIVAVVGAGVMGVAGDLQIPAFAGFSVTNTAYDVTTGAAIVDPETGLAVINKAAQGGFLFPALFVTIACGAISGFHSLVASGTTSKQIEKESQAQPIAYGGMLIECLLAVLSLCAVGFVWAQYSAGGYASPTQVFADGLSQMLAFIPFIGGTQQLAYALLILAVSAFCLTSLDTATRLARYMFQELWIPAGKTAEELTGFRKVLSNKYVATVITVVLGIGLGMTGYTIIWPLFGAANQLLAALALLTVCTWLGNMGRNNKMFYLPMAFMLLVTLTSLALTMQTKVVAIMAGGDIFAPIVQLVLAIALFVLAIILAVKGVKTIVSQKSKSEAEAA
ncbi:carbon starvation CstA family protein [Slackia heliotrinireducens]|uniref:carbon starvation CstA family protein n=1 Tax=Slackia heliotrinireducens TaxID=84110 RepID=UPI003315195A